MALTPIPNITCGFGTSAVIVRAYRVMVSPLGIESPPIIISGADVKYRAGLSIFAKDYNTTTNSLGIASYCIPINAPLEVSIKKSGEDFGSGEGQWKKLNVPFRFASVYVDAKSTKRETIAPPVAPPIIPPIIIPPPVTICKGDFVADKPDIQALLSGRTTPLTTLPIPVRLTESTRSITSIPVRILVDGKEVDRRTTGFSGFDAIRALQTAGADISTSHTITIESLATDCTIPSLTVNIPSLKPTGLPITPPGCAQLVTTVDSLNHPAEITDFIAPFYVYLRGIKEVCKTDPTNPAFISKLPKGTMGTITLGNLSSNFYLTDDGIVDIDLSKLINLPSLAGVAAVVTPTPAPVVLPVVVGERIGSYCTLTPMKTTFAMAFFDVFHDTLGKIYSGNTYDQAKYKAQQDIRCFPTPTVAPCISVSGGNYKVRGDNATYYKFSSSRLDGNYAEGSWRTITYRGVVEFTDEQNLEKAINSTISYLGAKFKSIYGRDMKRSDICGQ